MQAFNWPAIRARVTVDGVIAVVDGPAVAEGQFADDPEALAAQRAADANLDHDNPLEEVFEDQILCADLILLNKSDLVDEAGRARVKAEIAAHLPRAIKIVETAHGKVEPALIVGLSAAAESDLAARPPITARARTITTMTISTRSRCRCRRGSRPRSCRRGSPGRPRPRACCG